MDEASVQAVAALEEPTRRRLYEFVLAQEGPVGRDDAARAIGVPRATAAFHLDKLAEQGLLTVEFERRSGRTGPGAGRPAKLYRRSDQQIAVSLPERQYDLAGQLLATAIEDAEETGSSPRETAHRTAHTFGRTLADPPGDATGNRLMELLAAHGFEPRVCRTGIVLGNCPFHAIAENHPQLVCGMTYELLSGLVEALGDTSYEPTPDPGEGRCCVRLAASSVGPSEGVPSCPASGTKLPTVAKAKKQGTPATVALTKAGISFSTHAYEHDPAAKSYGLEAAEALGLAVEQVFKTLLVEIDGKLTVGVVPVDKQLDLKAVAAAVGGKKATMADPAAAERTTGYVVGGISPIGQKRPLPTVVDESAVKHETVYVSGGRRGFDIGLSPTDLITVTTARTAPIAR